MIRQEAFIRRRKRARRRRIWSCVEVGWAVGWLGERGWRRPDLWGWGSRCWEWDGGVARYPGYAGLSVWATVIGVIGLFCSARFSADNFDSQQRSVPAGRRSAALRQSPRQRASGFRTRHGKSASVHELGLQWVPSETSGNDSVRPCEVPQWMLI